MGTIQFKKRYLIYIIPAFVILGGFFFLPFVQTIGYSMCDWDGIGAKTFIGLNNYKEMFEMELIWESVNRVLQFAIIQPIVQIGIGIVLAFILRGKMKGAKFYRAVFFMPVVISSAAISVMFLVMYDFDIGLFNTILRNIGLENLAKPWLSTPETAFYAVIIAAIWQQIGMIFVVLLAGMQGIPEEHFEAAQIDGANSFQVFWKIAVPGVSNIVKICVVLSVSMAFKSFDYVSILTGGGPSWASHVPATVMYDKAFVGFRWGFGSAIAMFIFAMGMVFTLVFNRITREKD